MHGAGMFDMSNSTLLWRFSEEDEYEVWVRGERHRRKS